MLSSWQFFVFRILHRECFHAGRLWCFHVAFGQKKAFIRTSNTISVCVHMHICAYVLTREYLWKYPYYSCCKRENSLVCFCTVFVNICVYFFHYTFEKLWLLISFSIICGRLSRFNQGFPFYYTDGEQNICCVRADDARKILLYENFP